MPQFSIVIPVYNVAPYLLECLDSVVASVGRYGKQIELICIDDGSTDGSEELLDGYKPSRDLVVYKIMHQKNQGVSAARNKGLEIAFGEYICFVDADDSVTVDWLKDYAKVIDEFQPDIVRIGEQTGPVNDILNWGWGEFVNFGCPWMYALRRTIAQSESFPRGVCYSEDALYAMKILRHLTSAYTVATKSYIYRDRPGSASRGRRFNSAERLVMLANLYRVGNTLPKPVHWMFSRACMANILIWLESPGDARFSNEIRNVFDLMCMRGWISMAPIKRKNWIEYLAYRYLHLRWPARLVRICQAIYARIRLFMKG